MSVQVKKFEFPEITAGKTSGGVDVSAFKAGLETLQYSSVLEPHEMQQMTESRDALTPTPPSPYQHTAEEVQQARTSGYEEGYEKGYRAAVSEEKAIQQQIQSGVEAITQQLGHAVETLIQQQQQHQEASINDMCSLAVDIAQHVVGQTFASDSITLLEPVIRKGLSECESQAWVQVLVHPNLANKLEASIRQWASQSGLKGSVEVLPQKSFSIGQCEFRHAHGGMRFNSEAIQKGLHDLGKLHFSKK